MSEAQDDLLELTRKVLNDEELSPEEYAKVIAHLRGDRAAGVGKKAVPEGSNLPENLEDLFN